MMDIGVHLPEVYANRHFIRRKKAYTNSNSIVGFESTADIQQLVYS